MKFCLNASRLGSCGQAGLANMRKVRIASEADCSNQGKRVMLKKHTANAGYRFWMTFSYHRDRMSDIHDYTGHWLKSVYWLEALT